MVVRKLLKLIKLELMKNKLSRTIKSVIIINLVVLSLVVMQVITEPGDDLTANLETVLLFIDSFIKYIFIVYGSVLLGRYIIDEYKNNTITVLFTYPISRKKLMLAKLIVVSSFTLIAIVLSDLLVFTMFYTINEFVNFFPNTFSNTFMSSAIQLFYYALAASTIVLIPLFFGLRNKSVSSTIVAGIIIVAVIGLMNFDLTLYIVLAAIGVLMTYISLRNIDLVDVI